MGTPQTILIIDDDREISTTLNNVLSAAGYQVLTANNGLEGRRQIDSQNPDLVITDMMMPKMGGFPILEHINSKEVPPKVMMITANEGSRHKAYAEHLGAVDYLRKPFSMEVLLTAVENQIGKAGGEAEEDSSSKLRRKSK